MSETILTKGFKKKTTENLCNGDDHIRASSIVKLLLAK